MSLAERITGDLTEAMKARDRDRTSVLRMLQAAVKNARIEKRGELTDEDVVAVIRREVKRRREAAEQYEASGASDRAAAERAEAEILSAYLPAELPEEELDAAIDEIIAETGAESKRDIGKVMRELMARYRGRVDGKTANRKVAARLS